MVKTTRNDSLTSLSNRRNSEKNKVIKEAPKLLEQLYPETHSELNFSSAYELVVAVTLSAQCTDKKVNQVTPTLFKHYPSFASLAQAEVSAVEEIIRPINYFRTKAKNIIAMADIVTKNYAGTLPPDHGMLIELPGVGNKTANVVLSELGVKYTFPVDTHVFRLSHRLGLSKGKDVEAVERDLCKIFPEEEWRPLHHRLIFHGRRVCKAQNPNCEECLLATICPKIGVK